jgi:glycosyltransferase involved in cell wall biosynthesis
MNPQSAISNTQSKKPLVFSIVTPSYNQLDWLRLCVASVRDQVAACGGIDNCEFQIANQQSTIKNQQSTIPPLAVEHIIQDAGTPGIEEFAKEIGADLYRDGERIADCSLQIVNSNQLAADPAKRERPGFPSTIKNQQSRYRVTVYCESDSGMYDAINRGLRRGTGEICAWLNCDEQYLPGTLAAVADWFMGNPGAEVLAGDTILLDTGLQPRAYRKAVPPNRRYIQAYQMNLHSSSLFFRRGILDRGHWLGNRFRSIGDSEWVASMLDDGVGVHCLPQPLSTFVLGPDNLSVNEISADEAAQWRAEMKISHPERVWLRFRNIFHRMFAGAYLPRKVGVQVFITGKPSSRTVFPPQWVDFRFKA